AARELPTSEGRREAEVLIEPAGVRLLDDRDGAAVREPEVTGTDEVLHLRRGRAAGAATNAVGLSEARARVGTEDARIGQVDAGLTELARSKRCSDRRASRRAERRGRESSAHRAAGVDRALGEAAGGQVDRRAPAGRAVGADFARARGNPAAQRQDRIPAALEVVH